MRKIKFLSCAVMAAFMALGLTSCEKEDFSHKIIKVEAAAATVEFKPSIIAVVNGVVQDVTNTATWTPDREVTANNDGTIAEQQVTITATYNATDAEFGISAALTESITVTVPELKRGQTCTLTPTIILNGQTTASFEKVPGTEAAHNMDNVTFAIKNKSNFYFTDVNYDYEFEAGTKVENIVWAKPEYQNDYEVKALIEALNKPTTKTQEIKDIPVYAKSQTIITVTFSATKTTYTIKKKGTFAGVEGEIEVVTFDVIEITEATGSWDEESVNIHLDGIEHGHGHGHGHGHDNYNNNAGGGIILPE